MLQAYFGTEAYPRYACFLEAFSLHSDLFDMNVKHYLYQNLKMNGGCRHRKPKRMVIYTG